MPALPTNRHICKQAQSATRRKPGSKAKERVRSGGFAPNDFLTQSFSDISHYKGFQQGRSKAIETSYFRSLSNIAQRYELPARSTATDSFPYSILETFHEAQSNLGSKHFDITLHLMENEGETTIAAIREVGLNHSLYYVPISVLDVLHQRREAATFNLVASLFAYLYQQVKMSLPNQNDFLNSCYESIIDWEEQNYGEYEEEERKERTTSIVTMRRKLSILEKVVSDPLRGEQFERRVNSYEPSNNMETQLHELAENFLKLQEDFPDSNFYQNIRTEHLNDEDNERGYPDQYFSFFWTDNHWIEENLFHYVDSYLQEYTCFEQPVAIEYFNTSDSKPDTNLLFEKRLLELISDLNFISYKLMS